MHECAEVVEQFACHSQYNISNWNLNIDYL